MSIESETGAIPRALESLLDLMDDVVFFAKDRQGRYRSINQTLVRRLGKTHKNQVIGCRADELFPVPLGTAFRAQDEHVLRTGLELADRLELHLYPNGQSGWCRTFKLPVHRNSTIVGVMGFSKDLLRPGSDQVPANVLRAVEYLDANVGERVLVADLAEIAGMAVRSFERAVRELYSISAGDLIIQARLAMACKLLKETSLPISHIAGDCGYSGHSSFSRQFRSRVGVTPSSYRSRG